MYFQQGRLTFGQVMYQFLERSPQDTQDGFGLYSAQASFAWLHVDLVQPLLPSDFSLFGLYPSSLSKSAGFISLVGKLHWFLYLMLSYKFFYDSSMFTVFTVGVRISWKKLCWKGSIVAEMPYCVSYLVYYDIVWRVDLRKL